MILDTYLKGTLSIPFCHYRKRGREKFPLHGIPYRDLNKDSNSVSVGPEMLRGYMLYVAFQKPPTLTAVVFYWILKHTVLITLTVQMAFAYYYKQSVAISAGT